MAMYAYIGKRLLWAVFVTWFALSIVFGVVLLSPNTGKMAASFQAAQSGTNIKDAQAAYEARNDLDRPVHERYLDYMKNMATGNWGWSTTRNQPVMTAMGEAWPYSAQIMIPSTIISVVVGFVIGTYTAIHQHTWKDYIGSFIAFFGISVPNFWFAIMAILVVIVWGSDLVILGYPLDNILPRAYYDTSIELVSVTNLTQIVLPIFVTSTALMAGQMRYVRAETLEYMERQWVKAAKAKGANNWRIMTRHVLRVAIIPLVTILVGDVLALLWAGAFFVEIIFQIPGIGLLGYKAFTTQDTSLIMGVTLVGVFLAVIGNLMQDIAYVWLDPRINYGDRT